ncbi:frequency clock protein [Stachybotrys elegans]|uniref:Frequency clock protein n=1 Tax=Stachybotrys elegans TaxID=80388 RepID=A0A8K0WU54_9HYPO|nr:frequency clock protein [Stachybotrys elegans]
MPETKKQSQNKQPVSPTGHPLPRRASPDKSVTLRHHRLARDASLRASPGSGPPIVSATATTSSPRRNSSGDSHETGHSDPKRWFDQSNENPKATVDRPNMDVDPPFFQKESDSSNEDKPYLYLPPAVPAKLTAQSSSADDYRSVIDDLTVEIQKLKEELKRYKQKGPDMLKKEKLFEIKIHGLPKRKKRELEATLREFAAGLKQSPDTSSSQRKKTSKHATRDHMYSGSGSKHASSSSGSNTRPMDSAYASMSTGANSSGTSLGRPSISSRAKSSELKVENYLRDIPEGLYPRSIALTERDKKKMVVRRLEQLFTGKLGGRSARQMAANSSPKVSTTLAPIIGDDEDDQARTMVHHPAGLAGLGAGAAPGGTSSGSGNAVAGPTEPSREARILPPEHQLGHGGKKSRSREDGSTSNSNGNRTESGGNGNSSGSGTNTSPTGGPLPEQRPTRPKDLDPNRVQVPSENMDYIRHLGLVPPELLADAHRSTQDVHPDADGWVYLNLLCNLAQLHMINVTPDFVRSAVADWSTKFQLSPDGRKIRWRGGTDGTKFSSDSSGDNSQRSPDTDDTDGSNKDDARKRQKTGRSTGDEFRSGTGSSSKDVSKFGPAIPVSEESFHYKPLFVRNNSAGGQTSIDDTLSSFGPVESNAEDSRWGQSGSGTSNRRKRRRDGAIIYYSGAPFCTDLSGDPGDVSPATYMLSSGQDQQGSPTQFARPQPSRPSSGSFTSSKPLSDNVLDLAWQPSKMDIDGPDGAPGFSADSGVEDSDSEESGWNFPWSDEQQQSALHTLEPCGLGGVLPDDHFVVMVATHRWRTGRRLSIPGMQRTKSDDTTDSIISRLATMSTSSPMAPGSRSSSRTRSVMIEIGYLSGRIKRLLPVPLPPPAMFFPPFTDSSGADDWFETDDDINDDEQGDDESSTSNEKMSRHANLHESDGYPDGVDLSSGDEDGEDPEDEPDARRMYNETNESVGKLLPDRRKSFQRRMSTSAKLRRSKSASVGRRGGSSAATAGGVESGYSSSGEQSS